MNLVKSVVGTGLFALPNAYASVGLIVGVIGTILMGLLITVSLHILLRIHHRMCVRTEKPVLNYDEVVVASLAAKSGKPWLSAPVATYFIDIAILVCYIGVGAVCVVFVSGTIQESFDANRTIDQGYYALMLFPLFFLINMVKYLSDIAIVSIIGNLLLFCSALIGVVLALNDGIGDKWILIGPAASLYPKFIGTAFFSLSSPGIALAVEHDMKTPWNYTKSYGVLNQGMLYITLLHTFVGAVGYLKWGSNAFGNFIRNHPEHDSATLAALIMQALSMYFTYGLQCYLPIILIVNGYVAPAIEQETFAGTLYQWDLIVRLAITSLTCALAAIVPKVDLFISLVGSICISLLTTIIPVTLYILLHYGNYGRLKWKLILGMFLLILGSIITICAIVVNIILIIDFFRHRYFIKYNTWNVSLGKIH